MTLNDLKLENLFEYYNDQQDFNNNQRLLYFGIGSAANLLNNKIMKVKQKNMHQFPPLIQRVKGIYPNIRVDIFLIDAWLKKKPYIVNYLESNNVSVFQDKQYNNIFRTTEGITIYNFQNNVEYEGDTYGNFFDITPLLLNFNKLCMTRNDLLTFHDFSGRNTWMLAEYMDKHIGNNQNRIVYDLTLRMEGSCQVNLTDELFNLQIEKYQKDDRQFIKFINPFCYSNYQLIELIKNTPYKKEQLSMPIYKRINIFKKNIYPILRRFINHRNELNDYGKTFLNRVREHEFFFLDSKIHDMFTLYRNDYFKNKSFNLTFLNSIIHELKNSVINYLVNIFYLPNDDLNKVKSYIKKESQMIENDIYGWCDRIEEIFLTKIKLFLSI